MQRLRTIENNLQRSHRLANDILLIALVLGVALIAARCTSSSSGAEAKPRSTSATADPVRMLSVPHQ